MKYWLLFISSFVLSLSSLAQETDSVQQVINADTTATVVSDSTMQVTSTDEQVEEKVEIIGPHDRNFQPLVYLDYGKLGTSALGFDQRLEGGVSMLFYDKFEAIVEFGTADLQPEHAIVNGQYFSRGDYFRVGGGLFGDIDAKSSIGIGVRYGQSRFDHGGYAEQESPSGLVDDFSFEFGTSNLTARWWSAVLTSERRVVLNKNTPDSKLNHLVRIGFFFRMRFLVTYDHDPGEIDVYAIPGYGQTANRQQAAFNLFIKFTP